MPRTRGTLWLALLAALTSATGCGSPPACEPGHNIVWIVVDTLRADHLGAYGYPRDTSPAIDAFARESQTFRNAYTPRPKTTPAMAGAFSGRAPSRYGVTDVAQTLPPELPLLTERLQNCGYATGAIVSNAVVDHRFGFDRGFDHFRKKHDRGGAVTDEALAVLSEIETEPFFLWVHYVKPHVPYKPADDARFMDDGLFAVEHVPFGDTYHATFGSLPRVIEREGQTNPHFYVALYDSEIRDVDAEVGRLLDELRGRKLLDSSLVAIFSDHGESLGDQGYYFGHGKFPYDSTARVPLLLRVPGRSPARIDLPATLLDLPATLLAAAGLPALEETDGIDLLAAVDAGLTDRTIITESGFRKPQIQVRRRDAKLIYVQDEKDLEVLRGNPYEFYRTDADPGEVNDLAGRGDPAEAELRRELEAWLEVPRAPKRPKLEDDQRLKKQLRALGYAE
ncbi:MAG: sulfatase [Deltaproteobacteria bacterium]|nr:sulfatase [Deltaproteobacteria bacterium]